MQQPHQTNMTTHATPQGGSSPATPITMQYHLLRHLPPGASRHPYARQPWEAVPNVELNRNQVGPPLPPFNGGAPPAHPGLPRYQQLVYAHLPRQTPPYYSQMPAMRRQMDFNRNHLAPRTLHLHNTDDLAGAPARGALKPPECPVCMEPLQGLSSPKVAMMTPCGHLFCSVCLNEALQTKNECPTCRKSVTGVKVDGARRAFL